MNEDFISNNYNLQSSSRFQVMSSTVLGVQM